MERQAKLLGQVLKRPENGQCADCFCRTPRWASTTFGVFVCIRCSGFHRRLGTHITKVRSVDLDLWTQGMLDLYSYMNNDYANNYWEAALPEGRKPAENSSPSEVWRFIQDKYVKHLFAPEGQLDPAKEFTMREAGELEEIQPQDVFESEPIPDPEPIKEPITAPVSASFNMDLLDLGDSSSSTSGSSDLFAIFGTSGQAPPVVAPVIPPPIPASHLITEKKTTKKVVNHFAALDSMMGPQVTSTNNIYNIFNNMDIL